MTELLGAVTASFKRRGSVLREWNVALVLKFFIAPSLLYLAAFILLTYPAITHYGSRLYADTWDGLQYAWNLWWLKTSIVGEQQLPWHTEFLFYPDGTSLLGHTLHPVWAPAAIVLLPLIGLVKAYNALVILAFVFGGLSTFALAYYFVRSYWGALIAGFIFTFSSYHFAHTSGHLNLITIHWVPLFVLLWYLLLKRPSMWLGFGASLILLFVVLSDYYYALYAILAALIFLVDYVVRSKDLLFFLRPRHVMPLAAFLGTTLATTGLLLVALLRSNAADPLIGGHDPSLFSLDLFAPFIHGEHWRFSSLTEGYWSNVELKLTEASVHLGFSVLALLVYVLIVRSRVRLPSMAAWYAMLIFFMVMSLGPTLKVWGEEVSGGPMPYSLLEYVVPGLDLSGVPARMVLMTILAASVIAAAGIGRLMRSGKPGLVIAALLAVILVVEYLPADPRNTTAPIWVSELSVPQYVTALGTFPAGGSVLDLTARSDLQLYYQTVHGKPLALGKLARLPESALQQEAAVRAIVERRDYDSLSTRFGVRYLVSGEAICPEPAPGCGTVRLVYEDDQHRIYELAPASGIAAPGPS